LPTVAEPKVFSCPPTRACALEPSIVELSLTQRFPVTMTRVSIETDDRRSMSQPSGSPVPYEKR
jgi:hypothetical protein